MSQDHRNATRLNCDFPSRLLVGGQEYAATVLDLSRTGLRLRVAGRLLGVHRLSTLAQVAQCVEQALGNRFDAELHYPVLGPLIAKSMQVIRVGRRDWDSADVEIGCMLREPLADEEAAMLRLATTELGRVRIPAAEPAPPNKSRRESVALPRADSPWVNPGPCVHTSVLAGEGHNGQPLTGPTEGIQPQGLVVRVPKPGEAGLPTHSVTALAIALGEAYGTSVGLDVRDGPASVWAGPGRLRDVELIPEDGGIARLGLSFGRVLRPSELAALGLR